MPRGRTPSVALLVLLLVATSGGCGDDATGVDGDENSAPTLGSIADQTVVRNTVTPRSLELSLEVQDPDGDPLSIAVEPGDSDVVPDTTLTCTSGPCTLSVTPDPDSTAHVTTDVVVTDGNGGEARTSFVVHVVPLRVTNTDEDGPGSLRQTISTAEPGDVVGFDTDGVFATPRTIGLLGQIVVGRRLTVEGTGVDQLAVSGNDAVRVFKVVDSATVTVRDLTIQDGNAPLESFPAPGGPIEARLGGGVLVGSASRLTLENVLLTGNGAIGSDGGGGGAANVGGTLIITDSEASANTASDGGGVLTLALGGSEVATTIQGSTITGNTAERSGGGIAGQGIVLVRESTVAANQAERGGGIYDNGTLVVRSGSEVTGNAATLHGGGVWTGGTATIEASTIEGNSAVRGGGVYNRGTLKVESSAVISQNMASGTGSSLGGSSDGGGGIFNTFDGVVSVVESTVEQNEANVAGGGILSYGELTVQAGAVTGNVADADGDGSGSGGGVAAGSEARTTLGGAIVQGNSAASGGGISNFSQASLVIEDSELLANTAATQGGGLRSSSLGDLTVAATTVAENQAGEGGGASVRGTGQKIVQGSDVINNQAQVGGGIYYEGSTIGSEVNVVLLDSTTVKGNSASVGGGIFYNFSSGESSGRSRLVLQNESNVAENTATDGAGLYQTQEFGSGSNAETVIDDSSVEVNVAAGPGGGILIEGGLLTARAGATISNNVSALDGGGIHIRENVEPFREIVVAIDESGVVANEADRDGGGIYVGAGAEITVTVAGTSCLVVGNTADADDDGDGAGGGIYNAGGDISGVPSNLVCVNSPDDIAP